jgi:hypothetical protein
MPSDDITEVVADERPDRRKGDQEYQARVEAPRRCHAERNDRCLAGEDRSNCVEEWKEEGDEIREQ